MADNREDRQEDQAAALNVNNTDEPLELDDIAVSPADIELDDLVLGAADEDEDEEIIELTEEIVGSPIEMESGAAGANREPDTLDLFEAQEEEDEDLFVDSDADLDDEWLNEAAGAQSLDETDAAAAEAEIDKELDDYFELQETDEFVSLGREVGAELSEPTITPEMLDEALERVLNKVYGEKIEQLIADMVERKLEEKMDKLK